MYQDVYDLNQFYTTALGQLAKRILRFHIREIWNKTHQQRILGIGYTMPYLSLFQQEAERISAVMPATQGVLPWPENGKNLVSLGDIHNLPFEDYSMDRVLIMHCLESSGDPQELLNEAWRVLAGNGRLLLVVPNRLGLWARFEHTPFGTGQPYSALQAAKALKDASFTPLSTRRALYFPPSRSRFWLSWARAIENLGKNIFPQFSGALIIEARKDIMAAKPVRKTATAAIPIPAPGKYVGASRNFRSIEQ